MRRIRKLEWDDESCEHIAHHGVEPDEVEEVCFSAPFLLKSRNGTRLAYGRTLAGRYLVVVLRFRDDGTGRCITARPMTEKERRFYRQRKPKK